MNPDIPPGDVKAVRVEGGHVDDVVVVRVGSPSLNLAVADFQAVDVLCVEGPAGRVWVTHLSLFVSRSQSERPSAKTVLSDFCWYRHGPLYIRYLLYCEFAIIM